MITTIHRIPLDRILLLVFLAFASFTDLFQDRLMTWIDPALAVAYKKQEDLHGGVMRLNPTFPFTEGFFDNDFSDEDPNSDAIYSDDFFESMQLMVDVDQPTIKGCIIRYLIVDVSPQNHGPLNEWKTWRRWWKSTLFSGGIAKAIFIFGFYVCLISTALRAIKNDWDSEAGLTAFATFWGNVVFGWGLVIVPFVIPLLGWLDESIRYVFPGIIVFLWSIIWFLVRAILFLINLIGFYLIGTLLLVVFAPLLIMHGYVQLLVGM